MEYEAFKSMGMNRSWYEFFEPYLETEAFMEAWKLYSSYKVKSCDNVFPSQDQLFAAFGHASPAKTKVVILSSASKFGKFTTGVAFEHANESEMYQSEIAKEVHLYYTELESQIQSKYEVFNTVSGQLRDLRSKMENPNLSEDQGREYENDYNLMYARYENLRRLCDKDAMVERPNRYLLNWQAQGVILFNVSVTVGSTNTGQYYFWKSLSEYFIKKLSLRYEKIVWICAEASWAGTFRKLIHEDGYHKILFKSSLDQTLLLANDFIKQQKGPSRMVDWTA